MDRIHRLGQHRPVQVVKLVIEDSIESKIVQVCGSIGGILILLLMSRAVAGEESGDGRCYPFHGRFGE